MSIASVRNRTNRAGRLAALGCANICDQCGQERPCGGRAEGNPPRSGRTKPPQKTVASVAGFCKSGIVRSLLLQLQFLEGPLRRVFLFLSHRDAFVGCAGTGQNRNGLQRVCPNIRRAASAIQLHSVTSYLCNPTRGRSAPAGRGSLCRGRMRDGTRGGVLIGINTHHLRGHPVRVPEPLQEFAQ